MENRRPHAPVAGIVIAALSFLAGCRPLDVAQPPPRGRETTPALQVTQIWADGAARFVYCVPDSCSQPSMKTRATVPGNKGATTARHVQRNAPAKRPVATTIIDIAFDVDSSVVRADDVVRLRSALRTAATASIAVTGRSDASGALPVRQRIATARADAVSALVRATVPDAQVTTDHELAPQGPASTTQRRYQRRATVTFSPSLNQP